MTTKRGRPKANAKNIPKSLGKTNKENKKREATKSDVKIMLEETEKKVAELQKELEGENEKIKELESKNSKLKEELTDLQIEFDYLAQSNTILKVRNLNFCCYIRLSGNLLVR